ncbi:DUF4249 family protein [Neolewinella aurantiaca]|uniref:DUF4249 family protein n=1 Tax=Neolewinella aurantiaca TaxID=2602767 RepID=A0A5C7FLU3_9BACT|nr:DUF4249 family protein [Neolewinella aurantiaca]TXF90991.1 DUF4249 family protein [Neolewinella aurantiaca]
MKRISLAALLAVLLFGCVDEIDLTQGLPLPDGIVVSGRLLVDEEFTDAEVLLEELFRFENSNRPGQIVTADVRIVNNDGQELELLYRDGIYRATIPAGDPSFRTEEGMEFNVVVRTREGNTFVSTPETLPPTLEASSASATLTTITVENQVGVPGEEPAIEYTISTPLRYPDGSSAYVRWLLTEYYQQTDMSSDTSTGIKTCYIDLPFEGTSVKVVGPSSNVTELNDYSLGKNPVSFRYAEANYMEIRQEAISREAFTYFDQVSAIASTELSIFEAPGGPVIGNVKSEDGSIDNVFGYFYVTQPSIIRVPVTKEQAGNPTAACPLNSPMPPPVNRCTDCLVASNTSTTIRPPWWEL